MLCSEDSKYWKCGYISHSRNVFLYSYDKSIIPPHIYFIKYTLKHTLMTGLHTCLPLTAASLSKKLHCPPLNTFNLKKSRQAEHHHPLPKTASGRYYYSVSGFGVIRKQHLITIFSPFVL